MFFLGLALSFALSAGAQTKTAADSIGNAPLTRLEAFRSLLESIPAAEDSLRAHPLERFLYESITHYRVDSDTIDYVNLCQRVEELKGKATSALTGATPAQFQEAFELADGLYQIGFEHEAMMWLSKIDRLSPDSELSIRARRLIIFHGLVGRNAALLSELVERWDARRLSHQDGRQAALAMMSALYTLGEDETLQRLLDKITGPEPYKSFFAARLAADSGDYTPALRFLPSLLTKAAVRAPVNYRYAALMLAAGVEHQGGSAVVADREYRLLAEREARYVKDWALLELANHSWQAGGTQDAYETFGRLCNSDGESMWKQLSCRLAECMEKYRQSREGAN